MGLGLVKIRVLDARLLLVLGLCWLFWYFLFDEIVRLVVRFCLFLFYDGFFFRFLGAFCCFFFVSFIRFWIKVLEI